MNMMVKLGDFDSKKTRIKLLMTDENVASASIPIKLVAVLKGDTSFKEMISYSRVLSMFLTTAFEEHVAKLKRHLEARNFEELFEMKDDASITTFKGRECYEIPYEVFFSVPKQIGGKEVLLVSSIDNAGWVKGKVMAKSCRNVIKPLNFHRFFLNEDGSYGTEDDFKTFHDNLQMYVEGLENHKYKFICKNIYSEIVCNQEAEMVVEKRDGALQKFDLKKIKTAIVMAEEGSGVNLEPEKRSVVYENIYQKCAELGKRSPIKLEDIQDIVEEELSLCSFKLAKNYILYREHRKQQRDSLNNLNISEAINKYYDDMSWRVHESATVTKTIGGQIMNTNGQASSRYWMLNVYSEDVAKAHIESDIHLHDLSMLAPYCAGWSLLELIQKGIPSVHSKVAFSPAKHLSSLCGQIWNFLGVLQNEWAGAQALSSVDTYLAAYAKADNLNYDEIKQHIQSLVCNLNMCSRWGTQAPFTNFTFDWVVPEDLANQRCWIGDKQVSFTYGECQKEMDLINKAFLEVMIDGDSDGVGFQYPIPTYSITKDFDWDENKENNKLLFKMAAKYGIPYFSNYVGSDMKPSDIRSMCCRLRLDLKELSKKNGGFFGSGDKTGGIGVVSINLPRIGYLSVSKEDFFKRLRHLLDIAAKSLHQKRKYLEKQLASGVLPYTKEFLGEKGFDNHFSIIGIVGMHECLRNMKWMKEPQGTNTVEGREFSLEVLRFIKKCLLEYQERYGCLFNLEATPAESTSYRLAKNDLKKYTDIETSGTKVSPYYTNSTHLPVDETSNLWEAMKMQDPLQCEYTGGTVFHAFLGEDIKSWKVAMELVKKIAYSFKMPYFTLSPVYSTCKNHGYISGEVHNCPKCGEVTQVHSRITGYYRVVENWNDGKKSEFKERKMYKFEGMKPKDTVCANCRVESDKEVSVPEDINNLVPDDYVTVVTAEGCPKCKTAKSELEYRSISFREVDKDSEEAKILLSASKVDTLPLVIVPNNFIASGDEAVNKIIEFF